jgi:hypothetical protein
MLKKVPEHLRKKRTRSRLLQEPMRKQVLRQGNQY